MKFVPRILKKHCVFWCAAAAYIFSLSGSLHIPFIIDDLDHLWALSKALEQGHIGQWIFAPHNEHVFPFIKSFYVLSYMLFHVSPVFLHLIILGVCFVLVGCIYFFLYRVTGCKLVGLIGSSLWIGSNLSDLSAFVITNSHVIFSLMFLMALTVAIYEYIRKANTYWLIGIFVTSLLAPLTFALGHLSVGLTLYILFVSLQDTDWKIKKKVMSAHFLGWGLACIPYMLSAGAILHTKHYSDVGASSAVDSVNIILSLQHLGSYLFKDLSMGFLPFPVLSMAVLLFGVYAGIRYRREIPWTWMIYFLLFGLIPTFVIYCFRSAWGENNLGFSRYDVYPTFATVMAIAFLCSGMIKRLDRPFVKTGTILVCLIVALLGSYFRFIKSHAIARQTRGSIGRFYSEYENSLRSFQKSMNINAMSIKDQYVFLPKSTALETRKGIQPNLSRHVRKMSFFGQFLLPEDARRVIVWTQSTDIRFLLFLKKHQEQYPTVALQLFRQ